MRTGITAGCFALATLFPMAGMAQSTGAQPIAEPWTFALTPYAWLPSIDGTLNFPRTPGGGSPSASVDNESLLDALDFAAMLAGEARRGRWSLFGDYIYLKLSAANSAIRSVDFGGQRVNVGSAADLDTEIGIKGSALTLGVGYDLLNARDSHFDVFGGLRYFHINAKLDWQLSATVSGPGPGQSFARTGEASDDVDLVDGIVGVRGHARLGERWFVPFHFDVGAGSSQLTWQALIGIGYGFRWGDIALSYRYLEYDQKKNKLLQDFSFAGPMLSAAFRF